jgi:hypothetical protein
LGVKKGWKAENQNREKNESLHDDKPRLVASVLGFGNEKF